MAPLSLKKQTGNIRRGQTLVEYTLILGIISIIGFVVMAQLTNTTHQMYRTIDSQVARATTGS